MPFDGDCVDGLKQKKRDVVPGRILSAIVVYLPTVVHISRTWPAMAQAARTSLESEPDFVAYDSNSILPSSGSGYSYGPPASTTPSDNMSRISLDKLNNENDDNTEDSGNRRTPASTPSASFSNRSRARASSMASKFSNPTLPLYSAREVAPGPPTASTSSQGRTPNGLDNKSRHHGNQHAINDDSDEEDDDDGYSDESDLEMDTLNKNSGGKGGWKMIASTDTPLSALFSPSSHTHPPGRISISNSNDNHEKYTSHATKISKNSRFERFDKTEWIAMSVSLALVAFLTIASLHICFSG